MSEVSPLIEIGSEAIVDLDSVQDRLPERLIALLRLEPKGKVVNYKMTDGTGIGIVLELKDGSINWFFAEELKLVGRKMNDFSANENDTKDSEEYFSYAREAKTSPLFAKTNFDGSKVMNMFSPIYFVRWLIYSIKDIS